MFINKYLDFFEMISKQTTDDSIVDRKASFGSINIMFLNKCI